MIYFLIKNILKFYFWGMLNISVRNLDNIPEKGPAILVANHPSLLDGLLMVAVMKRRIYTFAKAKVFNSKLKLLFLKVIGGIPVGDAKDNKNAMIEAKQLLEQNKLLLIFPEGKVNDKPDLLSFKRGFLKLAVKCNAPVAPVVIIGSEKALSTGQFFPRPSDIYISFLDTIRFSIPGVRIDKKELQNHIEEVRKKILQKINVMRSIYGIC